MKRNSFHVWAFVYYAFHVRTTAHAAFLAYLDVHRTLSVDRTVQGVPTEVIFLTGLSCSLQKTFWGQHAHQIGALGWKFYLEMFLYF